jgi:hypothetical protein
MIRRNIHCSIASKTHPVMLPRYEREKKGSPDVKRYLRPVKSSRDPLNASPFGNVSDEISDRASNNPPVKNQL